ncbi:unnamed protein product [Lactuca saligna]|uniref:Uncharacterized protein n=1 Tax=Lactuca saligna TaxID=75948 RepID=A0AA35Z2G6_LACSI|nr:unnamed protein product [Lactuca saligna]
MVTTALAVVSFHLSKHKAPLHMVMRGDFIVFFNKIFGALCKLSADSDPNVQSVARLLDKLVKSLTNSGDHLSFFEHMNVLNPYVRQFLVGWINVLDSVPEIDILSFLPDFLDDKRVWKTWGDQLTSTFKTTHGDIVMEENAHGDDVNQSNEKDADALEDGNELVGVVSDENLLELLELAMSSNTTKIVKRARELMELVVYPMVLMSQMATLIMDIIAGT